MLFLNNLWLGGRDSNPDTVVQSHVSYRWTTSQSGPELQAETVIIHAAEVARGERHAARGEKSDSGCKVVDDDADVVQSLDRRVPWYSRGRARPSKADRYRSWTWLAEETHVLFIVRSC